MSAKKLIGLVCTNYHSDAFGALTAERPVASLPFAGRYRLVDFPLSGMVNSGIGTVGLVTPYMYRSLMDHVGVGKEWALSRKEGGMFILPGSIYGYKNIQGHFLLRDILRNLAFFQRGGDGETVLAASAANKVMNVDYRAVLADHEAAGGGVTLLCKRMDGRGLRADTDEQGRVTALEEREEGGLLFLDSFLMDLPLLLKLSQLYDAMGYLDMTELFRQNLSTIPVRVYEFTGYVGRVDDVRSYMRCNMDMLHYNIRRELFMSGRVIKTKVQDSPPAKYLEGASVVNSIVASGCIIRGTVENSVIFRGVHVEKGAYIKNSIVMQHGVIHGGAVLERVITDKYVEVGSGVSLIGESAHPIVIGKSAKV